MGLPNSTEARDYYRCAWRRLEDAQLLLKELRTTGAVYMAGYGVECILKALILSILNHETQTDMVKSFRGMKGHDFNWLRDQYLENRGSPLNREVTRAFNLVKHWSTDLRYTPHSLKRDEANGSYAAAKQIIHWADERI